MSYPECVQKFFAYQDQRQSCGPWCRADNDNAPLVYARHRGAWRRLVCATRAGRVGISSQLLSSSLEVEAYVGLSELSHFSTSRGHSRRDGHPLTAKSTGVVDLPAIPRSRTVSDILAWVSAASGLPVRAFTSAGAQNAGGHAEDGQQTDAALARTVAIGLLYGEGRRSPSQIGMAVGRDARAVRHIVRELGLLGDGLAAGDRGYLRGIWMTGAMPMGSGPKKISPAVTRRLAPYVTIRDGQVDAAARHALRHAAQAQPEPRAA